VLIQIILAYGGGSRSLWNVGTYLPNYQEVYSKKTFSVSFCLSYLPNSQNLYPKRHLQFHFVLAIYQTPKSYTPKDIFSFICLCYLPRVIPQKTYSVSFCLSYLPNSQDLYPKRHLQLHFALAIYQTPKSYTPKDIFSFICLCYLLRVIPQKTSSVSFCLSYLPNYQEFYLKKHLQLHLVLTIYQTPKSYTPKDIFSFLFLRASWSNIRLVSQVISQTADEWNRYFVSWLIRCSVCGTSPSEVPKDTKCTFLRQSSRTDSLENPWKHIKIWYLE